MSFYDAVTVGERGQVVIPQAAREMLGIKPGSKLLVMGGGGPGVLLLLKADMVSVLLRGIVERLGGLEKILTEGEAQSSAAEAKDRPET
jgi:AbrB family looped-hinge helix DNA binding protein